MVNDVSAGKVFGSDATSAHIIAAHGLVSSVTGSKTLAAHRILDAVATWRHQPERG